MMSRLEQLQKFFDEEPENPFNLYALALEVSKTDRSKAIELLNSLIAQHINYIPTYYMLGQLYEQQGEPVAAVAIYEKGIAVAAAHNDTKTLRELRAAYEQVKDGDDL